MGDEFFKDTPFEAPKRRLRVRKWKMLEVVDLDEFDDDFDSEVDLKEIEPRQKRRRTLQRKRKVAEKPSDSRDVLNGRAILSPELDTVRVYFACSNFVNLDEFIPYNAKKSVRTCVRDTDGRVAYHKEFFKAEMRCSWYGKMQVSSEIRHYGKNGKHGVRVLSFEYSVAKWYNVTSGLNSGMVPKLEQAK